MYISFTCQLNTIILSDLSAGQVVKDGLQRKLVGGSCEKGNNFGTWVLDTTYPYEPPPYDPAPGSPGSWATENVFHEETDTPSAPLLKPMPLPRRVLGSTHD